MMQPSRGKENNVPYSCRLALVQLSMLFSPILVVDREGIRDQASHLAVGLLRWEEIEEVRVLELVGGRHLAVIPRDLSAVLARPGIHERYMRNRAEIGDYPPILIAKISLSVNWEELLESIDRFRGDVKLVRPTG